MSAISNKQAFTFAIVVCLYCTYALGSCARADSISFSDIKARWNSRQQAAKTFDITWQVTESGSAAAFAGPFEVPDVGPEEIRLTRTLRLVMDQTDRIRFNKTREVWSPDKNGFVNSDDQEVFDGTDRIKFYSGGRASFPRAHISDESSSKVGRDIRLMPILMIFRAADPMVGIFSNVKAVEVLENTIIDGRQCVTIRERPTGGSRLESRVYADITLDYLPIRYEAYDGRTLIQQVQLRKFDELPDVGWIPVEWSVLHTFDEQGRPNVVSSAKVVKYEMNKALQPRAFKIEFPVGTLVADHKTGDRYLLKDGEEKRRILAGEYK